MDDINRLPLPAWDLMPPDSYADETFGLFVPAFPTAPMILSRGCPFHCSFCAWPQIMYGGSNYRMRAIEDVLDEMDYCVHALGFRSVYFDDDTFNISRARTLEFARRLQERQAAGRIRVPWAMMARADLMTEEILEELGKSGLAAVKYGVESANQELLDAIQKNMDFRQNDRQDAGVLHVLD